MCNVENCTNEAFRRGMCSLHYRRMLRGAPLGGSKPLRHIVYHGMEKHPLYPTWEQMRQRCTNPKKSNYKWYGAKGVTVCERWNDFTKFVEDMGPKPTSRHTLDRIDPNGHYTPENCRWATPKEQRANQRELPQRKTKVGSTRKG